MTYSTKTVTDCSVGEATVVDLTADELTDLAAKETAWQAQLVANAQAVLVTSAQTALAKCDRVAVRCQKAGVPYTSDWQTYDRALVAIVNGTDTTSTTLPTQPSTYPAGS